MFETVPELFVYEIGQLEGDERKKYSTRKVSWETHDGILNTDIQIENARKYS